MKIFQSASRVVFIIMATATVVLTFTGKVEANDFVTLTGLAFMHFFNKSKTAQTVDKSVDNSNGMPYTTHRRSVNVSKMVYS